MKRTVIGTSAVMLAVALTALGVGEVRQARRVRLFPLPLCNAPWALVVKGPTNSAIDYLATRVVPQSHAWLTVQVVGGLPLKLDAADGSVSEIVRVGEGVLLECPMPVFNCDHQSWERHITDINGECS